MVCTDIAARGLDNLAIDHVILFDFPTSPIEYIHRAGRTARAGAKGRVTSLILKKDNALAAAIERAGEAKSDTLLHVQQARREATRRRRAEETARKDRQAELLDRTGSEATGSRDSSSLGYQKKSASRSYNPKAEVYSKKARKYQARYGGRQVVSKRRRAR